MADEPITQKKTLKLKTSKPTPQATGQEAAAAAVEEGSAPFPVAAMPLAHAPAGRGRSYTFDAMMALTVFLMVVALLIFQWLEYSFYDQPPPVFPISLPGIPAGGVK